LEADIAALVSPEFFKTVHGKMDCRYCHNGVKFATTRKEAHDGMEPLPSSKYAKSVCAPCHKQITDTFATNLHAETRGVSSTTTALVLERTDPSGAEAVKKGLTNNCDTCHVSGCGDCHVSRPQFNDGGFVQGHVFYKSPNSLNNCMGCHGSRIEKEYTGKGESTKTVLHADVHWSPGGMQCTECHTAEWMHGGDVYDARYDAPEAPQCVDCHKQDAAFTAIKMHSRHAVPESPAYLQCQVCHAQDYNNCTSCHVALDENKLPYFETTSSGFDFNIGRNYDKADNKPWDFIVVRHVPIFEDTFEFYGKDALPNMAAQPTWKYATPHSIQRVTRQTKKGCSSCHGNRDIFLTEDDLAGLTADEVKANRPVVINRVPQGIRDSKEE
jgi:thiosulfate/3-mercaptopyruvate sulfurtransferase